MKILFEIGYIYGKYILVYLWSMYSSDRNKTVISFFLWLWQEHRVKGLPNTLFLIFFWEERRSFWFSSVILLNALPKSLHDQPLLDYIWDISRDWERLQRKTTAQEIDLTEEFWLGVCVTTFTWPMSSDYDFMWHRLFDRWVLIESLSDVAYLTGSLCDYLTTISYAVISLDK